MPAHLCSSPFHPIFKTKDTLLSSITSMSSVPLACLRRWRSVYAHHSHHAVRCPLLALLLSVPFLPAGSPQHPGCCVCRALHLPMPGVITHILSCVILPQDCTQPSPQAESLFILPHQWISSTCGSSDIQDPPWTPVPCLLKSPHLSSVPTYDSSVLCNRTVSVNRSTPATLPPT